MADPNVAGTSTHPSGQDAQFKRDYPASSFNRPAGFSSALSAG